MPSEFSVGRPYGWGNDMSGSFLEECALNVNLVVWASGSTSGDFFIPTFEGLNRFKGK